MKTYVISLVSREDRRKAFTESNNDKIESWEFFPAIEGKKLNYSNLQDLGFDTDRNWRDPTLDRTLTWGEVGCFLSHYRIWEECVDTGENILVLEDDAILNEPFQESWLTGELTYLTHKEMLPSGVQGDRVCYPYWTAAYIVTPKAAEALLETDVDQNIIPVDEYLPRMTDRVVMTFNTKAKQRKRTEVGTDVEPRGHESFVRDFNVHNLTCHDNNDRAGKLLRTNPDVENILDEEWKGGTMVGPGGGQKLNCLRRALNNYPDHDVVIFTDAFDVFWTNTVDEVVGRFLEMKAEVVFAAEKYLWPDKNLRFPASPTPYRYLNSGCFIGRVAELKRILSDPLADSGDDQLYIQRRFLTGKYGIRLDHEGYIFQTNSQSVSIRKNVIFNSETRCFGCIYHGNGGKDAKRHFDFLYDQLYGSEKFAQLTVKDYKVIGNEMLLVDFLSPSQCEEWIRIGEEHNGWKPHEADKFPSHDIHLKELGIWSEVESWWNKVAAKVFEEYWRPTLNNHLRKAFLMKYSEDTQKTLGLHTDASLVTGSVKLNDDYEGATLIFPRQNVTNKDIPVGKMILFPGQVTHGHYVDQLTSGTKYSATFWSARYKGDLLDP
jgi:GR25 family glycosyltransferase involved in LPS biosynthesis